MQWTGQETMEVVEVALSPIVGRRRLESESRVNVGV